MTTEQIIVALVVAAAIALSILMLSRRAAGKGCGCNTTTCPSADTCRTPQAESADPQDADDAEGPAQP